MGLSNWGVNQEWTLFLDRDGVINERIFGGYVLRWEEFHFLPGVIDGLAYIEGKIGRIIVVTNQQCVALGKISREDVERIHDLMRAEIERQGGRVNAVYTAIERKGDRLSRRKPNASMALEAQRDFPEIDFAKSIMVGDTDTDLQFGQALGMRTVLIESEERVTVRADFRCKSLNTFLSAL